MIDQIWDFDATDWPYLIDVPYHWRCSFNDNQGKKLSMIMVIRDW